MTATKVTDDNSFARFLGYQFQLLLLQRMAMAFSLNNYYSDHQRIEIWEESIFEGGSPA